MCGFSGEYRWAGNVDLGRVERMRDLLRHRGPDGEGSWAEGPVALAHARLAIFDLSADGLQPMANEDGRVRLVYNGELYNFVELRAELAAKGHRFRSRTDTEVLVHGYEEWGLDVLDRLNGIFAFALWDPTERRLVLARDRLGVKPLYLAEDAGGVSFASEAKALIGAGLVPPELDRPALAPYLALGYRPGRASFFRGLERVPPGTVVEFRDGRRSERRWWSLAAEAERAGAGGAGEKDLDDEQVLARYGELVTDSVRRQVVADVPVGLFLSGGLDSTTLLAALAETGTRGVSTFTIGFDHETYDELPAARTAAAHFGTRHREEVVHARAADELREIVRALDEPLADEAALPLWELCRAARRQVKVALAGEGGDELFGGYGRYFWDGWARRWARIPATLRAGLGRALTGAACEGRRGWRGAVRRVRKFARTAALPEARRYLEWFALLEPEARAGLLTDGGDAGGAGAFDALFAANPFDAGIRRAAWVDVETLLVDDLLTKVDRLSMAHGLEVRVPLLDHRLAGWAFSLGDRLKVRGGRTKWLMRRWLRGRAPASIVRGRKRGFEVPIGEWLRGPLREMARDLLSVERVRRRGLFRPAAVEGLLAEHDAGRADRGPGLLALLCLEVWMEEFGVRG
ncbi:MAG: asparagine synthase (glutamine-hydrolyzing) [Planctomycetes bacterium]|nr:asparagine synthase (glutamine-hydrolyzing) [Planctomycetota bacterium]